MKTKLFSIVIASAFLASCGGSESHNEKDHKEAATETTEAPAEQEKVSSVADFKFHSMIANLPSPLQTFQIINDVDMTDKMLQLTPPSKADNLSTTSSKAYGYGVFITDMGFMAYEQQNQLTLEYLQACRTLANALGAGDIFDKTVTANFEENSSEEAKFIKMMDEAFNEMDEYMVNNERFVNATEIFVGSWVESQLIATKMLKGEPQNANNLKVWDGIYSQKMHASNLINVLGEVDDQIGKDIYKSVEDLMMYYAGFTSVESITQDDLAELEAKLLKLKSELLK